MERFDKLLAWVCLAGCIAVLAFFVWWNLLRWF